MISHSIRLRCRNSLTILSLTLLLIAHGNATEPYLSSPVIAGITLDWSTHRREAPGSDNFQLAWADDDNLYGAWGDGGGFGGTNSKGRVGLGVARIEGDAGNYQGSNVWGGATPENRATFAGKSWGMISINKTLHMWVVPDKPAGKNYRNHYESIELASSHDHGASWKKTDWKFSTSDELTIPTFLNFGRDHEGVPEEFGGYVYSYFVRPRDREMEQEGKRGVGLIVQQPGALYLARVLPGELRLGKESYEFYAGLDRDGQPRWAALEQKKPVFLDTDGVGWCVSACYHPGLQRVLLCTEHDKSSQGTVGIFDSPTPWGPWTTVEYFTRGNRFGAHREGSQLPWEDNVFFISFATKWFDGDSFTLGFTGAGNGKNNDSFNTVNGRFRLIHE